MSKRRRSSRRLGRILFLLPIMALFIIVVVALLSALPSRTGTLVIVAQSSGRYYPSIQLHVSATVSTHGGITPYNVTLSQGPYVVTFSPLQGFYTPSPRSLTLEGGKTAYAIATYFPIPKVVSIGVLGFNESTISAMQGVTPVIWLNEKGSYVILNIQSVGRVELQAGQNFTYAFQQTGQFAFGLASGNFTGRVIVS